MNLQKRTLAIIALFVTASLLISCGAREPQTGAPAGAATATPLPHIIASTESLPTSTATIVQTPIPKQSPTGVTVKEQATASPVPSIVIACVPPDDWVDYTVQVNDTLSVLASRTNITVDLLMQANCLSGDLIFAGQTLRLPFIPSSPPAATMTPALAPTEEPTRTVTPSPTIEIPGAPTPTVTPSPTIEIPGAPTPTATASSTPEKPDAPGPGDPHVAVSPSSGPAGTTFTINIEHFAANEAITVRIVFVDTFEIVFATSTTVSATGSATVDYVSQSDSKIGKYTVDVDGQTSHASGEFTIK